MSCAEAAVSGDGPIIPGGDGGDLDPDSGVGADSDTDADTDVDGDNDTDIDTDSDTDSDTDTDSDSDTDSDGDTDGDTDADSDMDADTDTDIDTGTGTDYGACTPCASGFNFNSDNGGFTAGGSNSSWAWGTPTNGPGGAHSGTNLWATNLGGNYNGNEASTLTSSDVDLSGLQGNYLVISWWQWFQGENNYDRFGVEVSNTSGSSWIHVYGLYHGGEVIEGTWQQQTILLPPSFAVSTFRMRMNFRSDSGSHEAGWYIDDICIASAHESPASQFFSNFNQDNGGFDTSGSTSWAWGNVNSGPGAAHTMPNAWGTNLEGNYSGSENGYLQSPQIDLSGGGSYAAIIWWQWFQGEHDYEDYISLEASNNGGSSWTRFYGEFDGSDLTEQTWQEQIAVVPSSYLVNSFHFRFHFRSDSGTHFPGAYIDDVSVDVLSEFDRLCMP